MKWDKVDGKLKQISVSDNGHVWGTSANGRIWRWENNRWKQVGGKFYFISSLITVVFACYIIELIRRFHYLFFSYEERTLTLQNIVYYKITY